MTDNELFQLCFIIQYIMIDNRWNIELYKTDFVSSVTVVVLVLLVLNSFNTSSNNHFLGLCEKNPKVS